MNDICVLKFGSSILSSHDQLPLAVHEIYRELRRGQRVVAVTSAVGRTTDRLLAEVRSYGDERDPVPVAAFLATGEAAAAALLTVALDRAGIPATLIDPRTLGLRAVGPQLDAEPQGLEVERLCAALSSRPVVVVPGFFGQDDEGAVALFGRGGSDYSALYLAARLGARCRLLKDVDGLSERDPAGRQGSGRRYRTLSWEDAARSIRGAVQAKALHFAARERVAFEVAAPGGGSGTFVGGLATRCEPPRFPEPPLRVALLGLGHVGLGVCRHLLNEPRRFTLTAIAVRDPARHYTDGVPPTLLTADPWQAVDSDCDVLVEALGGCVPTVELLRAALARGCDVVTANKVVIAEHGEELERLARAQGAELRFSATVGGAVPVLERLEQVARMGEVVAFEGVLNGTTNYILDRFAEGGALSDAVAAAQARGYAEADPSADLDGSDLLAKLRILVRVAFGRELAPTAVEREGLERLTRDASDRALAAGQRLRLVGRCRREPGGELVAAIALTALPVAAFLAGARDEENRLEVELAGGERLRLAGKGAGRWPTAEAVLADLGDIFLRRQAPRPVAAYREVAR